jgi:hypothetical protein
MKFILKLFVIVKMSVFYCWAGSDIYLRTKIDDIWGQTLLSRISTFMSNNDIGSLDHIVINEDIVILEDDIQDVIGEDGQRLLSEISRAVGLNLNQVQLGLKLKGLEIFSSGLKFTKTKNKKNNYNLAADGFCLKSKRVDLSLNLPARNGRSIPVISMRIDNPMIGAGLVDQAECHEVRSKNKIKKLNIIADVDTRLEDDSFFVKFAKFDFSKILDVLTHEKEKFRVKDLLKHEIHIEDIYLEMGSMQPVVIKGSSIKKVLMEREQAFLSLMIDELKVLINGGSVENAIRALEQVDFGRSHWIEAEDFFTLFRFNSIKGVGTTDLIDIDFESAYCLPQDFNLEDQVCHAPINRSKEVGINRDSLNVMHSLLATNRADLVASVNENYLNDVIQMTLEAGYWQDIFEGTGIEMGNVLPQIQLNKPGKTGTFKMQIKYPIKRLHRLVVGLPRRYELLIPVIAQVGFQVKIIKGVPNLVFKLVEVDTSRKTMFYGKDEFKSTLGNMHRFRNAIIKVIEREISNFVGKDIVAIPFKEMRDLATETLDVEVDGHGRAHVFWKK